MSEVPMRSEQEVNSAIDRYADTVRRICMVHLKSYSDTEDIFQNVFLKYALGTFDFENKEHERAWFIRITINACKDLLKSFFRSRTVPLDALPDQTPAQTSGFSPEDHLIFQAVLDLPSKYKDVIYLHYYEGYSAVEIGGLLGKNTNTIYTWLARGKELLKEKLGGEDFE